MAAGFGDMIRTALGMRLNATDAEVLGRAAALVRAERDEQDAGIAKSAHHVVADMTAHHCTPPSPDTVPILQMTGGAELPVWQCPLDHRLFEFSGGVWSRTFRLVESVE